MFFQFQVSIYVLSHPDMATSVFNQILVVMTFFDTMYLVTSVAEFSFVESFHITSETYDALFVYFLYPMHNVTLCCSVFSHVVLAFERYLAVCHPQLVYTQPRRSLAPPTNGHAKSKSRVHNRARSQANAQVTKKVKKLRAILLFQK